MRPEESLIKSIAAGVFIGIGATVFLSCENAVVGAFLFAIGLLSICVFGLNLFTGKIGYVTENKNYAGMVLIWFGNLLGCAMSVLAVRYAKPALTDKAFAMLEKKAQLNVPSLIFCGIFCGIIMFVAVDIYKKAADFGKYLGILIGVPVFILCGFEHSIADMCYLIFAISSLNHALVSAHIILIVSISNGIGAVLMHWLVNYTAVKKK